MARSVHLSEAAYDLLTALKPGGESNSDVVLRLAGERRDPRALLDLGPFREGFDLRALWELSRGTDVQRLEERRSG